MAAKTFAEWYSDFISDNRMVPEWGDVKAAIRIKEARPTVRAKRPVQQRKVRILSEEEFVESLKKRIPTNKWNLGPSAYVASIAYRHFILMLKTQTVA
jgi:hypothetical protein